MLDKQTLISFAETQYKHNEEFKAYADDYMQRLLVRHPNLPNTLLEFLSTPVNKEETPLAKYILDGYEMLKDKLPSQST